MDKGKIKKLDYYHVIFLVQNVMIGVGLITLPHDINVVGNDMWLIPLILGGIATLILYPMVKLGQKYPDDSLFVIHEKLLGKWLGRGFNAVFTIYATIMVAAVVDLYVRLIQTITLPNMGILTNTIAIFIVMVAIVQGGIKSIARFSMLSFFFTGWMIYFLTWSFSKGYFIDAMPRFESELKDWLTAMNRGGQSMLGFELIMIYFPYIVNQAKAYRHAVTGIWTTIFFYFLVCLASAMYFSMWQVENLLFPILNLFKAVQLTFIERIENLGITLWVFLILSTTAAYLWAGKRGVDSLLSNHRNRTWHLYFIAFLALLLVIGPVPEKLQHEIFQRTSVYIGYGILIWPIFLLLIHKLKVRGKNK